MSEVDDWEKVGGASSADDWERIPASEGPFPGTEVPEAFLDRLRAGQALGRILSAAGHEAKEGAVGQTPTGYSDERLAHMIDIGVFHDPEKGRPGPIHMANEAVLFPIAQAWQSITSGINAGIHGTGGAMEQIVTEFGGSQGTAQRAKNETINAANWAMIEGGMGRFSRPQVEPGGVIDRPVGGLPKPEDFSNAAKVLTEPKELPLGEAQKINDQFNAKFAGAKQELAQIDAKIAQADPAVVEQNLKRMWQEDGIHPAEAVHDAATDAFVKHDITQGRPEFVPSYTPPDPLDLAMSGSLNVEAADRAAAGVKQYYKDVEKHIFGDRAEEWDKLNRGADRASVNMNDKLSRELREKQSKLEDEVGLSPADEDLLGGAGKPDTYDPDFWKGLKEDLHEIESRDDALATVAHQVRYLPKSRDWDAMNNSERQSTLVIFSALNAEKAAGRDPMLFLKEAFRQRTARYGGGADAAEIVQAQMKELRELMDGAIERSGVATPELRALPPPKALPSLEDIEVLTETGGKPHSLGAAANTEPPMVPLDVQPASPPGHLVATLKQAADTLLDVGRAAQMLIAPMARGTNASMAIAKDFANTMRRNRWDWDRIDTDIAKKFTPEQRARMWSAADEESTSIQLKEPAHMREHQGFATLEPAERAAVEEMQTRAQIAWVRARDIGMVEGEGLPAYTPRMVMNVGTAFADDRALPLNSIGQNLRIRTAQMLKRKHMTVEETEQAAKDYVGMRAALKGKSAEEIQAAIDKVAVARDIRVLPMATSKLEDAIAGRTLINNIKKYGEQTGADTVVEGAIPAGTETKYFTLDHPAFRTWRPKLAEVEGKFQAVKDTEGNTIFEQVPLYVHGDFEGPLRAVLSQKSGAPYSGMMSLKAKTMSVIMNSPMIHNAVEFGRAFPAMPVRIFKAYFDGNRAKNNVALMHEAIDNGLVPIGHRFFNQDISGLMEAPTIGTRESWTSKVLAAVPGLFDEAAGVAVKRAVDKAGDFWHNTLLWDRISDLQMGLYVNMRSDMIANGTDAQTSSRIAAHWANRYAGALPKEAMSDAATKVSNFMMFSRSFTVGNLGVLKDVFTGLPKDVLAQIERDAGVIDPAAKGYAKAMARRKAFSIVMMDIGLLHVANSVLQSALNMMLMDKSMSEEMHGYTRRYKDMVNETETHPLSLITPMSVAGGAMGAAVGGVGGAMVGTALGTGLGVMRRMSSTFDNEHGKQDRLKIGYGADGTAIYARSPFGKIGEEFTGYLESPIDMLKKKEGTLARPMLQVVSNDKGFGRKIYDPDAETPAERAFAMWQIIKHIGKSQFPEGQINAFSDTVKGEGDSKVNLLQLAGPLAGVTFSRGAPGGEAVGEMYHSKSKHDFAVNQALPDIRRQILRGDTEGAISRMTELDVPQGLQRFYLRTTLDPKTRLSPRATRDFYLHATPEQRARFDRAQQAPQPQDVPVPAVPKDPSLIMNGPASNLGIRG